MKKSVRHVVAIDVSPEIIALMRQAADFDHWPCRDKVTLMEADARAPDFPAKIAQCTGGQPVDYFYADIWPHFPAAEAPAQTAEMARALRCKAAGWWGQELSFAQDCVRNGRPPDEHNLRAYFTENGIPAPSITPGYAAFCRDAMAAYGMSPTKPFWRRLRDWWRGQ
ncbi:MAG: class I SAM-dependent methyltransferase [Rhodospirillaceae bacterium]